jgi:hypothetical protein
MKTSLLTSVAILALVSTSAYAQPAPAPEVPYNETGGDTHPTVMLGLAFDFGPRVDKGSVGITAKLLSTNEEDHFVFGGGLTYFPWAEEKFGLDASAGYNFDNFALMGGFDVIRLQPQISGGWVPTVEGEEKSCPAGSSPNPNGDNCVSDEPPDQESDVRFKRDIRLLTILDNGLRLYSFRYIWSEQIFVGVMAQDLLKRGDTRDAVRADRNGYFKVDYARLGLRMAHFADWQRHGLKAVVYGNVRRSTEMMLAA